MAVMAGRRMDVDNKRTWDMLSLRCLWNIPTEKARGGSGVLSSGAQQGWEYGGHQVLGEQSSHNNG